MIYTLPQIIQAAAERFPEHAAFRCQGQSLTYAALVQRSDALAATLQAHGVQRGDRVGILLNKSLESAVALFGIMRAGAAYVPLDPLAPAARIALVIDDCAIRHLVTHPPKAAIVSQLLTTCPSLSTIIGLPSDTTTGARCLPWTAVVAMTTAPTTPRLVESDLAYIMYTSGSTGRPKGLIHTHASGLSYARMAAHVYGLHHGDRLSNHSPLHFDMSTFDYFSGPLAGATTVIIPEPYTKLPASLSRLVQDERLTVWYSVPFALIQMLLHGVLAERDWSQLRWVLFGGEPFMPKHLTALMRQLPQTRFSNVYGPAEVNQCSYYHVPPNLGAHDQPVPIGRVWANAEGLIVDETDQVVAAGEIGELLVRTPTMMRGYWGQPQLTERSLYRRQTYAGHDDLFYRTGDLVQEQPDGELRFLGRKDRQIKTRGYRVELDEIETALATHPQVAEGAAYAVPRAEGSALIEAAVILRSPGVTTPADLKAHLVSRLPSYAVPETIVLQDEFPRTSSGKIDRRRLAEAAPVRGLAGGSR